MNARARGRGQEIEGKTDYYWYDNTIITNWKKIASSIIRLQNRSSENERQSENTKNWKAFKNVVEMSSAETKRIGLRKLFQSSESKLE